MSLSEMWEKGRQLQVPYLDQTETAPTGCESVSAVMLLKYLGFPVTIREFIEEYLERGEFRGKSGETLPCSVFREESTQQGLLPDGTRLIGPDPRKAFCGDPCDPDAMGCYAPVIRAALNRYFSEHCAGESGPRYTAEDETGKPLSELVSETVGRKGLPLLVWCTINMEDAIEGPRWYLEDGTLFTWHSREHCVLLTGFHETQYIIHDPWDGNGILRVNRERFERGWRQQGRQAVSVRV